jgi:hypothetical protein
VPSALSGHGIRQPEPREDVFRDELLIRHPAARFQCRSYRRNASEIVLVAAGRRDVTEQLRDGRRALAGTKEARGSADRSAVPKVLVATLLQEQRGAIVCDEAADLIGGEDRRLEARSISARRSLSPRRRHRPGRSTLTSRECRPRWRSELR